MMTLYLVQHGEALAKEVDPDRPLSGRGRDDVGRIAGFLGAAGVGAGRVLHSGKTRARETAEALAGALGAGGGAAARDGLGPTDDVEPVAAEAAGWRDDVALVGHLPFMARLAGRLVAGDAEAAVAAFTPGSVVALERDDDGAWSVAWMIRPELVRG